MVMYMRVCSMHIVSSVCTIIVVFGVLSNLQQIMKDQWINVGYEDDKLKPYMPPTEDIDARRLGMIFSGLHASSRVHETCM